MADKQLFDAVATGDANYLAALLSRKKGGLSSKNRVRGWAVLEGLHASHHVAYQYNSSLHCVTGRHYNSDSEGVCNGTFQ